MTFLKETHENVGNLSSEGHIENVGNLETEGHDEIILKLFGKKRGRKSKLERDCINLLNDGKTIEDLEKFINSNKNEERSEDSIENSKKRGRKKKNIMTIDEINDKIKNKIINKVYEREIPGLSNSENVISKVLNFGNLNITVHSIVKPDSINESDLNNSENYSFLDKSNDYFYNQLNQESENDNNAINENLITIKGVMDFKNDNSNNLFKIKENCVDLVKENDKGFVKENGVNGVNDVNDVNDVNGVNSVNGDKDLVKGNCVNSVNDNYNDKYYSNFNDYKSINSKSFRDTIDSNYTVKVREIYTMPEFQKANKTGEWPIKTDIHCWWCCHGFNTMPISTPYKYNDHKKMYQVCGVFCSWSCAKSYSIENSYDCTLLSRMYHKFGYTGTIKVAPPKLTLKTFGGHLTIEQFRNLNTPGHGNNVTKSYKLIKSFNMISLIPRIEESEYYNIDENSGTQSNDLRLKRTKPFVQKY